MYETRINNGINVLNDLIGNNWYESIDIDILDMADSDRCILGQLYRYYIYSPTSVKDDYKNGFLTLANDYAELTKQWKIKLQELKEGQNGN